VTPYFFILLHLFLLTRCPVPSRSKKHRTSSNSLSNTTTHDKNTTTAATKLTRTKTRSKYNNREQNRSKQEERGEGYSLESMRLDRFAATPPRLLTPRTKAEKQLEHQACSFVTKRIRLPIRTATRRRSPLLPPIPDVPIRCRFRKTGSLQSRSKPRIAESR
jgi:hypothetical protein